MLGLSLMSFCQMNEVLKHIETKLVMFQDLWRGLGFCLGASGHHIGPSWLHVGCLLAMLAQSWGILKPSWLQLRGCGTHPGGHGQKH